MLNPKHILITGASSGIGAALALLYAESGIRLSLHGRNGARLMEVAESARRKGAAVTASHGDVMDAKSLAIWIKDCDQQQPLDIVIANAGISAGTGGGNESKEQSDAIFATNFQGVLNTIHPAIELMETRKRGQIAIMSSLASFRGFASAPSYCASKAAVRVYGEGLRGDVASKGIEVNVICPGFIKTPMTDHNPFPMPFIMSPERAAEIIRKGLERNQPRIAFPWPMYALGRLVAALPQSWTDRATAHMPKKPSQS